MPVRSAAREIMCPVGTVRNGKTIPTSDERPAPPGPKYANPAKSIATVPMVTGLLVACIRSYTFGSP